MSENNVNSPSLSNGRKTKVGVVGVGVVGGAAYKYFRTVSDIDVVGYDKFREGLNSEAQFDMLFGCDVLFLCLPTLYNDELKQYDKSAIHEVCGKLNERRYEGVVVIKSTVEPGTTEMLAKLYDTLHIFHNPEFLTARTCYEDFANQSHVVIGRPSKSNDRKFKLLESFLKKCWPSAQYSYGSCTETEGMKIFCNSFYAMKVSVFNEFYFLCEKQNMDYNHVLGMMLKNGWINEMHTKVPGPDGKFGYAGVCLPKDSSALYHHMRREGVPHRMLKASVKENNEIRNPFNETKK